jgi:hypothetical protein
MSVAQMLHHLSLSLGVALGYFALAIIMVSPALNLCPMPNLYYMALPAKSRGISQWFVYKSNYF